MLEDGCTTTKEERRRWGWVLGSRLLLFFTMFQTENLQFFYCSIQVVNIKHDDNGRLSWYKVTNQDEPHRHEAISMKATVVNDESFLPINNTAYVILHGYFTMPWVDLKLVFLKSLRSCLPWRIRVCFGEGHSNPSNRYFGVNNPSDELENWLTWDLPALQ